MKLACEVVTLISPTNDNHFILSVVGIKRTLEILLIMQYLIYKPQVCNLLGYFSLVEIYLAYSSHVF
ncbi:hypothetical protein [Bacillus arachidis]|uniref:hypothetical protein n=1 Tax=Bacillus arachidis TaxID=2819290 RepID=UPI00255CC651|nr:hypothetical protein [Bacillus arachidis]WIY59144.1 hypothetical protein QRY57_14610 [Bacillus arachidis]